MGKLMPHLDTLEYCGTIEREQNLKLLAGYVRKHYDVRTPNGKLMTYPGTSDARIILTALDNDCAIVTNNVNEFMIYACLGRGLLDPVSNQWIRLDPDLLRQMHSDPKFMEFLSSISQESML